MKKISLIALGLILIGIFVKQVSAAFDIGTPDTVQGAIPSFVDTGPTPDEHWQYLIGRKCPPQLATRHPTEISNQDTENTIVTAGAAGVFRDITSLVISNDATNKNRIFIRDATAGTILYRITVAANGGGIVMDGSVKYQLTGSAAAWTAEAEDLPQDGTIQITVEACDRDFS